MVALSPTIETPEADSGTDTGEENSPLIFTVSPERAALMASSRVAKDLEPITAVMVVDLGGAVLTGHLSR